MSQTHWLVFKWYITKSVFILHSLKDNYRMHSMEPGLMKLQKFKLYLYFPTAAFGRARTL